MEPIATETQAAYANAPPIDLTQQIENRINTHRAKSTWRAHSFTIGDETQYPSYCAPIAVRGKARGFEPEEQDPTPALIEETIRNMAVNERDDSMFLTQRAPSTTNTNTQTQPLPKPVSLDIGCSDEKEILNCKREQYPKNFKGEYTLTTREDPNAASAANARMYLRHHLRAHHFDLGSYESSAQYMARVKARSERVPVDLDYTAVEDALRAQNEYVTTHNATYNSYNLHPESGTDEPPPATLTKRSLYSPLPSQAASRPVALPRAPTPPVARLRAPASEPLQTTTELAHGQHSQVHPDNRKGYNNSWRVHRPPVFSAAVEDAFLTHQQRREMEHRKQAAADASSTGSFYRSAAARGPVVTGGRNNNSGAGVLTAVPRGLQYSSAQRYFGPGVDALAHKAAVAAERAGKPASEEAVQDSGASESGVVPAGWSRGPAAPASEQNHGRSVSFAPNVSFAPTDDTPSPSASAAHRNGLAPSGPVQKDVWHSVTQQSFVALPVDPVQLANQRERNRTRTLEHKYSSHISLGTEQRPATERFRSETQAQYVQPNQDAMVRPQRYRALHEQTVLGHHIYQGATDPDHWRTSALRYD